MPNQYTTPSVPCTCRYCGASFAVPLSRAKAYNVQYCSLPCRHEGVRAANARNRVARFQSRLDRSAACWEWTGGKTTAGYGLFCVEGNHRVYAHRFAYELAYGPIPHGLLVCHSCDNPSCCNPDHLWLGNDAVNAADMVAKGRSTKGDKHAFRRNPELASHGEAHVRAILRERDVIAIRSRHAAGGITLWQLAEEYGVSSSAINAVIRRRNWKHVA